MKISDDVGGARVGVGPAYLSLFLFHSNADYMHVVSLENSIDWHVH